MNILMLNMERSLFQREGNVRNSALERVRLYKGIVGEITLIVHTSAGWGYERKEVEKGLVIIPTNGRNRPHSLLNMLLIAMRVCDQRKVDVIMSQDPFGIGIVAYLLKLIKRKPLSVNVYSSFFDDEHWLSESLLNRLLHPLGKFIVRHADSVRVECETERRKMVELGVDERRIAVAPVLVELERFYRADGTAVRRKLLKKGFGKLVLYIGRLSPEKNVALLVRAAKGLGKTNPEALVVIVGAGAEEERLKALADELGAGNVFFAGKIPYEQVPAYHAAADVFVLPSMYEGIPLVLVEAAAAGKPVVCTELRDAKDVMIDGKSGFIVPQDDEKRMAGRIAYLLGNPEKAREMGRAGREYVRKLYDRKRNLKALIGLWKKTAARAL